ncbi:MAG: hypothetical protein G01um101416_615 [Microgenomates group bacterium Gr01-1014_16]|nr:MAG: hypothetical protein G01um101416_615 [Microgenomates group bacterium Gr01-1014_16]
MKAASILLFAATLLAIFISINGISANVGPTGRVFQILFLPVTIYLAGLSTNYVLSGASVFGAPSGWAKALRYYCLLISAALVVAGFISAGTPSQFIVSIIFSSLVVYFLISVWPSISVPNAFETTKNPEKVDVDRRDFLKLIGTAGISIFLYNLLFRRDSAPLFSSPTPAPSLPLALKNVEGQVIDPAEKSPTQGYYISQIDESAISYFGFINKTGQWFIMRQDTDNSYRYSRGDKDSAANWANRSKLSYDYFDNVF